MLENCTVATCDSEHAHEHAGFKKANNITSFGRMHVYIHTKKTACVYTCNVPVQRRQYSRYVALESMAELGRPFHYHK